MTTTRENATTGGTWLWDEGHYETTATALEPYAGEVVGRAAPRPGEHVLDLGTGTGNVALRCAATGARTSAIDLARRLLGVARDRARAEGAEVTWLVGDAQQLPLLDEDVDVAVSVSALVLVPDAVRSAVELVRVLRPGGRAVIGGWDWAGSNPFAGAEALASVFADSGMARLLKEDPGWFSEDGVRRLFSDLPVDVEIERLPFRMSSATTPEQVVADFADHPVAAAARARLSDGEWDEVEGLLASRLAAGGTEPERVGSPFEQTAMIIILRKHPRD